MATWLRAQLIVDGLALINSAASSLASSLIVDVVHGMILGTVISVHRSGITCHQVVILLLADISTRRHSFGSWWTVLDLELAVLDALRSGVLLLSVQVLHELLVLSLLSADDADQVSEIVSGLFQSCLMVVVQSSSVLVLLMIVERLEFSVASHRKVDWSLCLKCIRILVHGLMIVQYPIDRSQQF